MYTLHDKCEDSDILRVQTGGNDFDEVFYFIPLYCFKDPFECLTRSFFLKTISNDKKFHHLFTEC